jgi:hypothetical protein
MPQLAEVVAKKHQLMPKRNDAFTHLGQSQRVRKGWMAGFDVASIVGPANPVSASVE